MKAKVVRSVKKLAAVATGALFLGATMGMASVFASGLSSLPGAFVSNGHVNSVFVVGQSAAVADVIGAIDISAALTASAAHTVGASGQISVGSLALSSKAHSTNTFKTNGTQLAQLLPSVNLVATNFTSGGKNYTSVENVSFSSSILPKINGLNVLFPAGAYYLQSYIVNRSNNSNSNKIGVGILNFTAFSYATNVTYALGNNVESLLKLNTTVAQFGTTKSYTNVKTPTTITQGPNSVLLQGVATFAGSTPGTSYNQLEISVNGGALQYINFSKSTTVGNVTINPGPGVLSNSTGSFVRAVSISSIAHNQNVTGSHVSVLSGLGSLNVTVVNATSKATGGQFVLTSTTPFTLPYSFSKASSFSLPQNLTTVDLQSLTHTFVGTTQGQNVTLTVGKAGYDNATVKNASTAAAAAVALTSNVPNIGVGAGALYTNAVNVPSTIQFGPSATKAND